MPRHCLRRLEHRSPKLRCAYSHLPERDGRPSIGGPRPPVGLGPRASGVSEAVSARRCQRGGGVDRYQPDGVPYYGRPRLSGPAHVLGGVCRPWPTAETSVPRSPNPLRPLQQRAAACGNDRPTNPHSVSDSSCRHSAATLSPARRPVRRVRAAPADARGEGRWTFCASAVRTSRFAPLRRLIPSLHRKEDRATPPAMS